ncbi:erythrocyte membrane protein 1, PfEMP1, putative [Plasmodium sp. DRC-Itaito]|nr:erythrocyte membrane protein 1, PfEMP1, putative [Plasmodium sp. DRC-Itaito]
MGTTQSQEKSSLLKNFQYMIGRENGKPPQNTTLLYFDYLNFLKYELDNEAWKWKIYEDIVKKNVKVGVGSGGGVALSEEQKFCGWKDIQKQIFNKLNEQINGATKYNWENDVLPLINIKEKTLKLSPLDCSKITVDANSIKELQSPEFPDQSKSQTNNCGLKTSKDIHVPLRRRGLLVDQMYEYLEEIKKEITDESKLNQLLEGKIKAKTKIGNTAIEMKKEMIEGISKAISDLIKGKYNDNEHDAFCKEWYRTMEDYHTLLLGDDIVNENKTKKIQCTMKQIEKQVGGSTKFKHEWSKHFKTIVHGLQKGDYVNPITNRPCTISLENKSQCVRFFEEWAEEFCKLKKDLGQMVVDNCKGDDTNENCTGVCKIYKNLIDVSRPYFYAYMDTCEKTQFGNNGQNKKELQDSFIKAAMDSMTDCCTELGHCSPDQLFNVEKDKGNIKYKCFCKDGKYHKEKDKNSECQKILTTSSTIHGRVLSAREPGSASQHSGPSGSATPQCGTNTRGGATAQQIAQQLQLDTQSDAKKDGKVGTDGQGELKAELKGALFGSRGDTNSVDDACSLDIQKHTNDKRQYDANANGTDPNKHSGPCTGKGPRFKVGERWEPHKDAHENHKTVLFPPRRKNMCTSNLENLNTGNMAYTVHTFSSHSLLADVLLTAKEEAQKIIEQYKQQNDLTGQTLDENHKKSVCQAMKYSFADLGDIIRGRDLWKNNPDMIKLEEKLKTIFQKIKEQKINVQNVYTNTDNGKYTEMRKDWWELNRKDVWSAMQCELKKLNITKGDCKHSSTIPPFDDYIPQRLRWLTEWAENYCRIQAKEYNELVSKCGTCKTKNGNCDNECQGCKDKCKEYETFIKTWNEDWDKQKTQYKKYYNNAKDNKGNNGKDENEKYLYKFLYELHDQNNKSRSGSTSGDPYGSAGGYIHSVLKDTGCQGQKQFCGENTEKENAFREKPHDYDKACGCEPPVKLPQCTDNKILDAANIKHHEAQNNVGTGSILVGKLSQATFKGGEKYNGDGDICKLDKKTHTNDVRTYKDTPNGTTEHNGPCSGKWDQRFNIGKEWENKKSEMRDNHSDVLLPPRRQHMCTSNLENLASKNNTPALLNHTSVNDSFFGDVLLAAKEEGHMITQLLNNDTSRVCNAMKYSFADLGDIIRGKDMWNNSDMVTLQGHLDKIFQKIKNNLDDTTKSKYSDTNLTTLRNDWWSANRDQIWKALTCSAPFDADLYIPTTDGKTRAWKGPHCGRDKNYVPVDDYIPQRLRWMTEWTEWYCKKIRFDYIGMMFSCGACNKYKEKGKDQDNEKKKICKLCKGLCDVYTEFVNKWKKQWNEQQSKQYQDLYNGGSKNDDDEITKETKEFLKKLKGEHNTLCTGGSDNNTYQNAADFIDSMGGYKYCKDTSQNKFKETEKDQQEHVFKDKPHKYKDGSCEIVKTLLQNKKPNDPVDNCNQKYDKSKSPNGDYPEWDCENKQNLIRGEDQGACMPPRRQKLCLFYLKNMSADGSESDLRTAFIKTAAARNVPAWQYYIQLRYGYICKKRMQNNKIMTRRKQQIKIDKIFLQMGNHGNVIRARTCKNGGKIIKKISGKAMICGLSYHD